MAQSKAQQTGRGALRKSRQEAAAALLVRIASGNELRKMPVRNKAELSELRALSYTWNDGNKALLEALFTTTVIADEYAHDVVFGVLGGDFDLASEAAEATDWIKGKLRRLEGVVERLQFMDEPEAEAGQVLARPGAQPVRVEQAIALESLHPSILDRCRVLYEAGAFGEAVEKGFKLVRDRLRALTSFEMGSDAFGRGGLRVDGSAAAHVDADFQAGVKFLTMAIDRFRNEKSHTADGNITDPIRAYEYLRLSSLALHLLERAHTEQSSN